MESYTACKEDCRYQNGGNCSLSDGISSPSINEYGICPCFLPFKTEIEYEDTESAN